MISFFFFQAEDGIRDRNVTGVQTCALPIWPEWVMAFWATVASGAIAVACNGWWTADELTYAIGHSQPTVLIADRRRLERLGGIDPGVPVIEMESELRELVADST